MINIDNRLATLLSELGYDRIKVGVYRFSDFEPQVGHFLYFRTFDTDATLLTADFGVRNLAAEEFGVGMLKAYGNRDFARFHYKRKFDCCMRFDVWRFFSLKRNSWRLSDPSVWYGILDDIEYAVCPFRDSINNLDALIERLVSDAEPCPWFAVNGAIRAAELAHLARATGRTRTFIKDALMDKGQIIEAGLSSGTTAETYVNGLFEALPIF